MKYIEGIETDDKTFVTKEDIQVANVWIYSTGKEKDARYWVELLKKDGEPVLITQCENAEQAQNLVIRINNWLARPSYLG